MFIAPPPYDRRPKNTSWPRINIEFYKDSAEAVFKAQVE